MSLCSKSITEDNKAHNPQAIDTMAHSKTAIKASGIWADALPKMYRLRRFGGPSATATSALLLALMLGPITLGGCHEKPSEKECEAAAKKRARYFFGTGKEKDTGSARQTKRSEKLELEASMDDCKKGWSKSKAICVAESKNRNMMISCK